MSFPTHEDVIQKLQMDHAQSEVSIIDSAEVGNDEGDDVIVFVARIKHPAMPDITEAYETVRFIVYKHDEDHAAFSGIIR